MNEYMHDRGTDRVLADMGKVATNAEPTYTWYDGESGNPIVRVKQHQADACDHQGACDDDVAAYVDRVEWIGDSDTIRAALKQYGAWEDDELDDDEKNKHLALWLAAGDIREQPDMYID